MHLTSNGAYSEAHFCNRSHGFRPNRSAENAIADATKRVNQQNLTYVVDIDIQGFFDEVSHVKLMRQLWTLGIRDKQLLVIIRKILKAPVQLLTAKRYFRPKVPRKVVSLVHYSPMLTLTNLTGGLVINGKLSKPRR